MEGQGSTFTVYLPASERLPSTVTTTGEHPAQRPGRILVMDDEPGVRNVVARMLQSLGWEAETVADGAEAIERCRSLLVDGKKFDAVVLDLTIPGGLGGAATVKRLLDLDPDMRAIAASGYTDDPVLAEHRAFGFRAALRKPFRADDLRRALQAATAPGP